MTLLALTLELRMDCLQPSPPGAVHSLWRADHQRCRPPPPPPPFSEGTSFLEDPEPSFPALPLAVASMVIQL